VDEVTDLFDALRSAPVLPHNAPPHAGAVSWVRGLRQRLAEPFSKLQAKGDSALLEGREGRAAAARCAAVMERMEAFEAAAVEQWCNQVGGLGFLVCSLVSFI
jgi:dynein heavy chain